MQVPQAAITEGRAVTLRSVLLPQRSVAVAVALALVLLPQVSVDAEAASVQRVIQHQHQQRSELVLAVQVVRQLASTL